MDIQESVQSDSPIPYVDLSKIKKTYASKGSIKLKGGFNIPGVIFPGIQAKDRETRSFHQKQEKSEEIQNEENLLYSAEIFSKNDEIEYLESESEGEGIVEEDMEVEENQTRGQNGAEKIFNQEKIENAKLLFSRVRDEWESESEMDSSSDSEGKLQIVEDYEMENFKPGGDEEDYEIDIVDANEGYEVHIRTITQEEMELDLSAISNEGVGVEILDLSDKKQEEFLDIMSLPVVFEEDLNKEMEEALLENVGTGEADSPGQTSQTSSSPTRWNSNQKKYYVCLQEDCLFDKSTDRFDTKQCFKKHLQSAHGVMDKDELENMANNFTAVISLASMGNETPVVGAANKNKPVKGKKPATGRGKKKRLGKAKVGPRATRNRKVSFGSDQVEKKSSSSQTEPSEFISSPANLVCEKGTCSFTFDTERDFRYHIRVHHSAEKADDPLNTIYKCEPCGTGFRSKKDHKKHAQMHALNDPVTCKTCKRRFQTLEQLNDHNEEIHSGRVHTCDMCGQEFRLRGLFQQHLRSAHSGEAPLFLCPICDKSFVSKPNLGKHVAEIHGLNINRYECEKCGGVFNSKIKLTSHMYDVHKKILEKENKRGKIAGVLKKKN